MRAKLLSTPNVSYSVKFIQIEVIFINGLYVVPTMIKGFRGFSLTHESDYFKEREFFHKTFADADQWVKALQDEADYHDFNKIYQRMGEIGKGKFSTVYNVRNRETNELFAMKYIDKNRLTMKEKEFLREEI